MDNQPDGVGDVSAALAMGRVKRWGIDKIEKMVEVTVIQGGVDVVSIPVARRFRRTRTPFGDLGPGGILITYPQVVPTLEKLLIRRQMCHERGVDEYRRGSWRRG